MTIDELKELIRDYQRIINANYAGTLSFHDGWKQRECIWQRVHEQGLHIHETDLNGPCVLLLEFQQPERGVSGVPKHL